MTASSPPKPHEPLPDPVAERLCGLRGVRLILLYLAALGTLAFVLTAIHPGGPF